ncbi:hypothetical protein J6590_061906 [Homalodisca vitripennis]|nr:hypothetical protein J6590_061906 [Homalodisca vitripennis]
MEGRRIQWMGHVKRMGDNRMPRIALEKEEGGRRPRGRPRGRWEDQVWRDIERRGLQKIQVEEEETWNDRQKWRRLCTTTRDNGNRSDGQQCWLPPFPLARAFIFRVAILRAQLCCPLNNPTSAQVDSSVDHKHSINDALKINPSWWGRNNDMAAVCMQAP